MARSLLALLAIIALIQTVTAIHHGANRATGKTLAPTSSPAAAPITTPQLAPIAEESSIAVKEDTRCEKALRAVETQKAWKGVDQKSKDKFLGEECTDPSPETCQTYSDVYLMSPQSNGTASVYAVRAFKIHKCETWPAFSVKTDQIAGCYGGEQVIRQNIKSAQQARRKCLAQIQPKCVAYTWSNVTRLHIDTAGNEVRLPANALAMCSKKLHGYSTSTYAQVGHRLRSYLIRPDTSSRCDEAQGKIFAGITSNADARALCDKQRYPPCLGYVWSGPIGIGHNKSEEATPNTVMLCAGFRNYWATDFPGSGYETASVVGEYMVHPNRKATCSLWSQIGTKWDVYTSMQARLWCDTFDGMKGPKCLSYVWNKHEGSVALCASVPQTSNLPVETHFETAWQRPDTCEQISNRWSVSANVTWGFATNEIKALYTAMNCNSKPTDCKTLSNYYGLSPKVDWSLAVRVPGSIRDLWIQQKCATWPSQVGKDRQKPAYQSVLSSIDAIEERVAEVDDILRRATLSKSPSNQKSMAVEIGSARTGLEEAIKSIPPVV